MHHSTVADQFRDFDGRDVQRIRQSIPHRDAAHEFFPVVVRSVFLPVEFERSGLVIDGRSRRDDRLHSVNGIVQGRGINERFENRPRLAMRQSVIELAQPVIPPANHRLDLAVARIERYQRNLGLRDRVTASLLGQLSLPLGVLLRQQRIHVLHPRVDRGGCSALQRGVKRGVNAKILAEQLVRGVLVKQMIFHHVHEIRRFGS